MNLASQQYITVILADKFTLTRTGIVGILHETTDIKVVAEVASIEEIPEQVALLNPQIVILDMILIDSKAIPALKRIIQIFPETKFLVLSTYNWDVYLIRSWDLGAVGFLVKSIEREVFLNAIRVVAHGVKIFSRHQEQRIFLWQQNIAVIINAWTLRERDVILLISKGCTNYEIATILCISNKTVETHVSNILSKMSMVSRRDMR